MVAFALSSCAFNSSLEVGTTLEAFVVAPLTASAAPDITPPAADFSCEAGRPADSIASPRSLAFSGRDSSFDTGPVGRGALECAGVAALEIGELYAGGCSSASNPDFRGVEVNPAVVPGAAFSGAV